MVWDGDVREHRRAFEHNGILDNSTPTTHFLLIRAEIQGLLNPPPKFGNSRHSRT